MSPVNASNVGKREEAVHKEAALLERIREDSVPSNLDRHLNIRMNGTVVGEEESRRKSKLRKKIFEQN